MEKKTVVKTRKVDITPYGLCLKDGLDSEIEKQVNTTLAAIIKSGQTIINGYFTLLPWVAIAKNDNIVENLVEVKSLQELLQRAIGTSPATASELVKVASSFYDGRGELVDEVYKKFKYSELVLLSRLEIDDRDAVLSRIAEIEEKEGSHKKLDVVNAIKENKAAKEVNEEAEESATELNVEFEEAAKDPENDQLSEEVDKDSDNEQLAEDNHLLREDISVLRGDLLKEIENNNTLVSYIKGINVLLEEAICNNTYVAVVGKIKTIMSVNQEFIDGRLKDFANEQGNNRVSGTDETTA